jgi:hypothetical protein
MHLRLNTVFASIRFNLRCCTSHLSEKGQNAGRIMRSPNEKFPSKADEGNRFTYPPTALGLRPLQFLVIGSAIAGFASLSFGLIATRENNFGVWAGAIGALTSIATILSQQLHCVKAVNCRYRMTVPLDAARTVAVLRDGRFAASSR